ncbi:MAG TPA: helix-turn-helix domain-containing protein [Tepidiformaceae bacterium]|nr:helix-turn-helix domain-containing protein [Tepidiformaceae bacterium]
MPGWFARLRSLREQEGISRDELARRAGISASSIKAYESGVRHPSRPALAALLDSLTADAFARREILVGAGFAPDGRSPAEHLADEWFSLADACDEIAHLSHPACVTTELFEVVAANPVIQRVWEVDLHQELDGPFERGFLSMLSTPRFGDRLVNWTEALSVAVSVIKGHYGGEDAIDPERHPYLAAAIQHLLNGSPEYVQKFLSLWMNVPGEMYRVRLSYPVVWDHSELGPLRFVAVTGPANRQPSLWFNDWMPTDAHTAAALVHLASARDSRRAFFDANWPGA